MAGYSIDFVREQNKKLRCNLLNSPDTQAETPDVPPPPPPPTNQPQVQPQVQPEPSAPPPPPASSYDRAALSAAIQGKQFGGGSTDLHTQYNATDFINQNQGGFAQGVTMISPDKIRLPDGEIVDISRNVGAGGQGGAWWGSEKDHADGVARGVFGPQSSGGAAGGGGMAGAAGSAGSVDPFQASIRAMLMEQLGKMGKDPTIDDPALQGQSQAYRRAQVRSGQDERAALAERAAFQGLNAGGQGSGAFETNMQGIQERIGQNTGAHDAGLVGAEAQNRRGHLQNLLQMALASGDSESARAVQMQMAQMDQAIRQATLEQQRYQYDDRMGFDLGRANEDDFRYRTNLGTGGV